MNRPEREYTLIVKLKAIREEQFEDIGEDWFKAMIGFGGSIELNVEEVHEGNVLALHQHTLLGFGPCS